MYACVFVVQSESLARNFSEYIIDEQNKPSPRDCP